MTLSKSWVIITLSALSLLSSQTSANIQFAKINVTAPVKPGDSMTVVWTETNATNGTVLNTSPFNLVLRALTGQKYNVQTAVPQEQLSTKVTIPIGVTGGYHSWYCDYTGADGLKGVSSNQFNVTGAVITTTVPPVPIATSTSPIATTPTDVAHGSGSGGGLSGGALGGIIGGVVAVLLIVALVFFFRHRRLVRERGEATRLEDTKERYEDRSIGGRSGQMGPPPPPHSPPSTSGHTMDGPGEAMMMGGVAGAMGGGVAREGSPSISGPNSLSPRQQHHPYSPPQLNQQPHSPYGPPGGGPMMGGMNPHHQHAHQQHPGGPFNHPGSSRDSFESELESAYDPSHPAMQMNNNNHQGGPIMRNNSNIMMGGGPMGNNGNNNNMNQLQHSLSGRSNVSDPRLQNGNGSRDMSPHPHNPFQDPELMAAAAGAGMAGAAAIHHHQQQQQQQQQYQQGRASPTMMHRQLSQNRGAGPRSQSPMRSASPYNREIEMQPLDVQQHQYEQQQRVLQRQLQEQQQRQLQQQQQQKPQPVVPPTINTSATTTTQPATPIPFNPTMYDDKTEVDDDGIPVYNGYRDTIFGAYAAPQDDEDDEGENDHEVPMPIVPAAALKQIQHNQQEKDNEKARGGAGVERKKSVKFTGVPPSGPIVVPNVTVPATAPMHQQQSVNQYQQQQMYHSEGDDEDEDEEFYEDEDEDDIKMRMMESEVPSPVSSHSRPPLINTTPGSSPLSQQQNALSPVRGYGSPTQYHQSSPVHQTSPQAQFQNQYHGQQSGFVAPPPPAPPANSSGAGDFGNGFYEDVLAAVDNNAKTLPLATSPTSASPSFLRGPPPTSTRPPQHQQQQQQQQQQQHYVQQQHIPAPQPTHMQQEVFGAPSPRIVPAQLPGSQSPPSKAGSSGSLSPVSQNKPAVSPRSAARPSAGTKPQQQQQQSYRDADEDAFYESSLL